ncbi:MAG: Crp/Fnr family transcriptional regulator [Sporolactobacillus sp.]
MCAKETLSPLQQLFIQEGQLRIFKKGEMIFSKEENANEAYYIENGLLKICQMTQAGQDVTFFVRRQQEYFGIAELILGEHHSCYAQCLVDSRLRCLPAKLIKKAYTEKHEVTVELLLTMTKRLMQQERTVEQLASRTVPARAAWLLEQLYQGRQQQAVPFPMPLTHQELSNMIGCSRQTLSDVFRVWRARGIINYTRSSVTILQPERLKETLWLNEGV